MEISEHLLLFRFRYSLLSILAIGKWWLIMIILLQLLVPLCKHTHTHTHTLLKATNEPSLRLAPPLQHYREKHQI